MTLNPLAIVSWAIDHKAELLGLLAVLVTSASAIIKAAEVVVSALLVFFPALKTADGKLVGAAAWLDALSKSSILNMAAWSPKHTKALLAVLALGLALHAAPARAQVLVSAGPTLPLLELRPGQPHPVQLAPGAGIQLSLTEASFTRAIGGRAYDLLDVNVMLFGTAVSASSGETFGALSAAVGLCTLSSLICLGGGHDVATAGGLKSGFFGLVALNFNMALAPSSPPAGVAEGALGLPRGNTLFLGAP